MPALNDYRLLGKSGLRVSPLSLGAMTFGDDWGWGADRDESRRQFDAYADKGGNFIDSANVYTMGSSERLVGEFVQGNRDYWVIATKYTNSMIYPNDPNGGGNHRKNMMRSLEDSLKRLGTDYIDLYYVHVWEFRTRPEEIMRALDDVVRQGKVLYVGVSNAPAWKIAQCNVMAELKGWVPFAALELEYSLVERTAERDLLPMCREFGIGTTPYSPLAFGLLSGKYSSKDLSAEGDDGSARLGMIKGMGKASERNLRIADEVIRIASEVGRTPAQVAVNWVCSQPDVTSPIVGARTLRQLEDNLAALDFTLDDEHAAALDEVSGITLGYPHDALLSPAAQGSVDGEISVSPPGFKVI